MLRVIGQAIVGILLLVDVARILWELRTIRLLAEILNVGGAVDFVIQHAEKPGWVGIILAPLGYPIVQLVLIIGGLVLIYLDSRPAPSKSGKVISISYPALGMIVFGIGFAACAALYFLPIKQASSKTEVANDAVAAPLSQLHSQSSTQEPPVQIPTQVVSKSPEAESRANRILIRQRQLSLFEIKLNQMSDQIIARMDDVSKNEVDWYAHPERHGITGRDKPMNNYRLAVSELQQAAADVFASPPLLAEDGSFDPRYPAPGDDAITDWGDKMKYRQTTQQFARTRFWIESLKDRLKSENFQNDQETLRFKDETH